MTEKNCYVDCNLLGSGDRILFGNARKLEVDRLIGDGWRRSRLLKTCIVASEVGLMKVMTIATTN
jgi:hypothetical protein